MPFRQTASRLALPVLIFALLFRLVIHPVQHDVESLLTTVSESAQPRVLLLTAHPDDECMFFAPTLLGLIARQRQAEIQLFESGEVDPPAPQVYSLCLSVGDGDGDGAVRAIEFERSLDVLGIKREKRWVLDKPNLKDNITQHWDPQIIADTVRPYILEHGITTILTFDHHGISSHPNHVSLPAGGARLLTSLPPTSVRLFTLITVPIPLKYIGMLAPLLAKADFLVASGLQSLGLTVPQSKARVAAFIGGVEDYVGALSAMQMHKSQLVWFRWLYVAFSRYMWVNEWMEVTLPPTPTS